MASVEGISGVMRVLRKEEQRGRDASSHSVIVGYTQAYAVWVHENVDATFKVGQAKFLEEPARLLRTVLGKIVGDAVRRGATILQALLLAGLRLQRESQLLCPVDTGALRASAFTREEK
jgi:hypothetical protein